MRQWIVTLWAMYRKDLREIRGIGLALAGFGVFVFAMYVVMHELPRTDIKYYSPLMHRFRDLSVAMPYMFPTLLAYMLFQKHHEEIRYLEQSLPVWRSMPVISAYLALMTVVIPYAVITQFISAVSNASSLYAMYQSFETTIAGQDISISLWALIWRMAGRSFFSSSGFNFIANLAGIVCLASGIAGPFATKRWEWYWAAFTVTIAVIYGVPALMARYGVDLIPLWWNQSWLLPGPVLVLAGAMIHQRFAET